MTDRIGFHASHELFPPGELLALTEHAHQAGFTHASCSDHFHPWTPAQGQSGSAWPWLGAALHATNMTFGTVNAPGQRYHPAVIAQTAATLAEMFPNRFWLAVGTGEALNESITADPWPPKDDRRARLRESVDIMRALWSGQTVTHNGPHIRVRQAKLYSLPKTPPQLFGAAITPETARWVAPWADGLITVAKPPDDFRKTVDAFHDHGGAGKPVFVQAAVAWSPDESEALATAHRNWPMAGLTDVSLLADLPTPESFAARCATVTPAQVRDSLRISSDLSQHAAWIAKDLELGAARVYLHHLGPHPRQFLDAFATHVLPAIT